MPDMKTTKRIKMTAAPFRYTMPNGSVAVIRNLGALEVDATLAAAAIFEGYAQPINARATTAKRKSVKAAADATDTTKSADMDRESLAADDRASDGDTNDDAE